jgi:hypothetical protein
MDIVEQWESVLEKLQDNQYVVKDVPIQLSEIDREINETFDSFSRIDQDGQSLICQRVTVEMAWLFLCFGIRMATYALRLSSQKYFTNGLLAIGMTLGMLDEREMLVILPLYCDVQKKTGLSFDEVLKRNNAFSSVLKNFMNRDEKDRSLECMGYILEIDENDNPTYQRTW